MLSPPVDTPTLNFDAASTAAGGASDREFHLVLIDNGRMAMCEDDQLRETLYCIRCGACAHSCANLQHVGGHAFGGETYTGGIATGWEAGVEGLDIADEFNERCTGCTRCINNCPVKIDIPWINTVVDDRINHDPQQFDWLVEGLTPDEELSGLDLPKRFFGNFETPAKRGSATAPVSNWVAASGPVRTLLELVVGVTSERDLPTFERETLRDWFEVRGGTRTPPEHARREVVLYPDVYTNYVQTDRGKATVRTLEALSASVRIPDVPGSGRASLSQGMISTARKRAEAVEYVYGLLANGAPAERLPRGDGRQVAYHGHCQQRTLGLDVYTEAVFEDLGYTTSSPRTWSAAVWLARSGTRRSTTIWRWTSGGPQPGVRRLRRSSDRERHLLSRTTRRHA